MNKKQRIFAASLAMLLVLSAMPALAQQAAAVPFGKFSAENLRGEEPVTEAYFQEADITLVNFWATWCGPCVNEMPDLAKLSELTEGRAQVLAVQLDSLTELGKRDEGAIEAMHTLMDSIEADFPVVVPDEWLMILGSKSPAIPTTFLVDKEGNLIGKAVIGGKDAEAWLKTIEEALADAQ